VSATATRRKPRKVAVEQAPGHIVLPSRCKPSVVCSTDRTRPILLHAYLRRRKGALWVCATDSYIAVAIKVEGDAEEGFIPVGALRLMERGQAATQLSKTAWTVKTNDGAVTFDIADKVDGAVNYPDFDKFGLWEDTETAKKHGEKADTWPLAVGINAALMKRIQDGLGATHGCRFDIAAPLRPIRVTPLQSVDGDRVALQMPMRINA
jgi:hypothetical protein